MTARRTKAHKLSKAMVVVGSLLGFLSVAVVDFGRTAPGEITRVHGALDELKGGASCNSCHGGLLSNMHDACLDCHETIATHLEDGVGLHGTLDATSAARCATCHSEHNGPGFPMVNAQSFRMAGVPDRDAFDHAMIGFQMEGKHLELTCIECHEFADHDLVPQGEHRFIGLSRDCASCHEDPHEGSMQRACVECHVQTDFDEHRFVGHDDVFELLGSHGEATCQDCHAEESRFSLAAHGARRRAPQPRECAACHESPHREGFIRGNAAANEMTGGASCTLCHDPEVHEFRGDDVSITAAQHAASGFSLGEPHDALACADCHAPAATDFAERFPGRGPLNCAACHEDPHRGQFDGPGFSQGRCVECHATTHFEPHEFDAALHAREAIALTGAHASIECADCHETFGPREVRRFRGTPNRCEGCHSDAHEGAFDRFRGKLARAEGGNCALCHSTDDFATIPDPGFRHAEFTGFAVLGAHAQSRCETCHAPSDLPDEHGRTFGRVADHFGAVQGCADCHEDVHEGRFDARGLPRKIDDRTGCARCHDESSFRAMPYGFEHERWTGFPLTGAHGEQSCSTCHPAVPPSRVAANGGRSWSAAVGNACQDCHADPHAGQFREDGVTHCSTCHAASHSFGETVFRHNLDSRFALDETHAALACSACHEPVRVGEVEVVRYKPLGRECSSCHAMNQDVLRRPRRGSR